MPVSQPTPPKTSAGADPRRVHAVVALRILEALRDQDLPAELLEDEDPSRTMPRRFGLSHVVDRQIRKFQAETRQGVRLTDAEITDLFRFVIRRPDGQDVFEHVGRSLAAGERIRGWGRLLPGSARYGLARAHVRRRLRNLFGRPIGGFAPGPFVIEGRALLFVESDPGGEACYLVSGYCQEILTRVVRDGCRLVHSLCQSRGDPVCRWEAVRDAPEVSPEPV